MMRFGVVGTGYWARETHATALAAHPDAELVGVWGRSFERAADLADRFGTQAFAEADQMCRPAWLSGRRAAVVTC
jgi:predicted dehydrogenase